MGDVIELTKVRGVRASSELQKLSVELRVDADYLAVCARAYPPGSLARLRIESTLTREAAGLWRPSREEGA